MSSAHPSNGALCDKSARVFRLIICEDVPKKTHEDAPSLPTFHC